MRARQPLRLAVGPGAALALLPDGTARNLVAGTPDELAGALIAWREELGESAGDPFPTHIEWSFLPPLVDVRVLELPPVNDRDTTTLLTRHAARYFPRAREPQLVAWKRVGRTRKGPVRVLAAAASEPVVEALTAALVTAGFTVGDPVPAHVAWAAAAGTTGRHRTNGAAAVVTDECIVTLAIRRGVLVEVASFPGSAAERAMRRAREMAGSGTVSGLGNIEDRSTAAAPLMAARLAAVRGLELVSAQRKLARQRRESRWTIAAAAVAVALFVAAGLVELWGVKHELGLVRAARASLAEQVASIMATRADLTELGAMLATVDSLARTPSSRTAVLADLGAGLPETSYLTALRVEGDSVLIEGIAAEAAPVFTVLSELPGFDGLRATSPIRREPGPRGPVERFTLSARVSGGPRPAEDAP
ncbi:MAG TPA: PilN domain-containing protein [Longimicrobiales bacterium]|nr:PilN domain-containing protein [Longimicrobiales bacterium]